MLSPTLNFMGPDEPIKIGVQMDDQSIQTLPFIPPSSPGTLPPQWNGDDGYVANSIVSASVNVPASPGTHTLKVRSTVSHEFEAKAHNYTSDMDD